MFCINWKARAEDSLRPPFIRLRNRGIQLGSGKSMMLRGRTRSICKQTNTGIISLFTLQLSDEMECLWICPKCHDLEDPVSEQSITSKGDIVGSCLYFSRISLLPTRSR
jgi:hypothetical protein